MAASRRARWLRRLGLLALAAVVALLAVAGGHFAAAHRRIEALVPPVPEPGALVAALEAGEAPVALYRIETARQSVPRSAVLDPALDPSPESPYVMAHTAFAVAWADGRLLLIDLGMDAEGARAFGRPIRWLTDAGPVRPGRSVAEALGPDVERVAGVVLTHLHEDHVQGARALCAGATGDIPLFRTRLQGEEGNYTTAAGRDHRRAAGCLRPRPLGAEPARRIPGLAGVAVVAVAGHTPGSQVVAVRTHPVGGEPVTWVVTGDVVNAVDGVRLDLPKPPLYSLLMVPEAQERLAGLRAWLGRLASERGTRLLVPHDALHLEESGLPEWPGATHAGDGPPEEAP